MAASTLYPRLPPVNVSLVCLTAITYILLTRATQTYGMAIQKITEEKENELEKTLLEKMGSNNNNFPELSEEDFSLLAEMYPEELLTSGPSMGPVEKRLLVREARSAGKRRPRRGRKGKGRKRNGKRGEKSDATVETNKAVAEEKETPECTIVKKTVTAPRPSESIVQLWSPMSKKGDGYLQVSKAKKTKMVKGSNISAFKLQATGKTDVTSTYFRWKVEEMDFCSDTGELMDRVSIKIAGADIDPKDSVLEDKTYSVCLARDGRYVAVEDNPRTGTPDPEVIPKENCIFLCGYEEHLGWHITLKDSEQQLLGCDGSGKTRQLPETGNWPQYYPQPGSLFYLTELNKH